jgi:hypothetical protein
MFNGEEEGGAVGWSGNTSDPSRALASRAAQGEKSARELKACGSSVRGAWSAKKSRECGSLDGFTPPTLATPLSEDSLRRSP